MARTVSDAISNGSVSSGAVPNLNESRRLSRRDRRDVLLDAAAQLLAEHGASAVTMDSVAAVAGVSRPLLYKHFANREQLVADLVRREVDAIDAEVSTAIAGLTTVEQIVRVSAEAVVESIVRRGGVVQPLLRAALADEQLRREQQARHRRTRQWYVDLIVDEYGIDPADAQAAVALYYSGLDAIFASWHAKPTRKERQHLIDVYVRLVIGGLYALAQK